MMLICWKLTVNFLALCRIARYAWFLSISTAKLWSSSSVICWRHSAYTHILTKACKQVVGKVVCRCRSLIQVLLSKSLPRIPQIVQYLLLLPTLTLWLRELPTHKWGPRFLLWNGGRDRLRKSCFKERR